MSGWTHDDDQALEAFRARVKAPHSLTARDVSEWVLQGEPEHEPILPERTPWWVRLGDWWHTRKLRHR